MITIHLTPEDVAKIRFAYSPMVELSDSYRVLISPTHQGPYGRWIHEARRALYGLELPFLHGLLEPRGYIPDFLTPTPTTTRLTIEDEVQRLLALPDDLIRMNVGVLIKEAGETEMRCFFMAHPREALNCLAEELLLYWQRALAHHWARMTAVLEGDILYRARMMALEGVEGLFAGLHPTLRYQEGRLQIMKAKLDEEMRLNGEGLQLVPSAFSRSNHVSWQIVPEWRPMVVYGARGIGIWRQEAQPEPDPSLELALGAGRARVLQALVAPLSTGELALKLGISAGAVSQHLERLNRAGLVEPHRSGHRVYHYLTQRGEGLLRLFNSSTYNEGENRP